MFQDFGRTALISRPAEPLARDTAGQVAELVARYPNLSEIELARLINLYGDLSALDMALMISDTELAPRLDSFFNDHRSRLRTPFRQYAALVVVAALGICIAVWAVISGRF
jgi:hypothetical protein